MIADRFWAHLGHQKHLEAWKNSYFLSLLLAPVSLSAISPSLVTALKLYGVLQYFQANELGQRFLV